MSLYCTLPRAKLATKRVARRNTWSSAVRQSDDEDVETSPSLSFNPRRLAQSNLRATRSELCLSSAEPATRLYYAVDRFEDVRALRRSSITNLDELVRVESKPDFYGGSFDSDSAYESSYESNQELNGGGGESRRNSSVNLPDSHGTESSSKKKSKYFTLPSRLGRRKKSSASSSSTSSSSGSSSGTISFASLLRRRKSNEPFDRDTVAPQPNGHHNQGRASNFHCCCRMGCHCQPNQSHPTGQYGSNANNNVHCCDNILETLWEEVGEHNEVHMVAAFEQSLSSMTSRLNQLTFAIEEKDRELHRLRSTINAIATHPRQRIALQNYYP